ncbi:hypothetical protein [Streptomyces sp. NBC_01294]|uniref:hypothetical protein n=1 Tax=Streptomyces sp. NBC_01294 TaxID=2903815 RepID=UPI002DDC007F|nr:hypothetical protein [Streptomyces sp. NBC_01294]
MRAGQYVYIESKVGSTYEHSVGDKTTIVSTGIYRRQIWQSADGTKGWLIDPHVPQHSHGGPLDRVNEK